MNILTKIDNMYIKGWINEEEYKTLIEKHTPKNNTDKIKDIIGNMSVEELLETYKNNDSKIIKYLIISQLEKW